MQPDREPLDLRLARRDRDFFNDKFDRRVPHRAFEVLPMSHAHEGRSMAPREFAGSGLRGRYLLGDACFAPVGMWHEQNVVMLYVYTVSCRRNCLHRP